MPRFNLSRLLVAGALISIIFCFGCGTVITRTAAGSMAYWDNNSPFTPVYPATCLDAEGTFGPSSEDGSEQVTQRIGYFFDLPFSLAIDTLCLPFDIYKATSRK